MGWWNLLPGFWEDWDWDWDIFKDALKLRLVDETTRTWWGGRLGERDFLKFNEFEMGK